MPNNKFKDGDALSAYSAPLLIKNPEEVWIIFECVRTGNGEYTHDKEVGVSTHKTESGANARMAALLADLHSRYPWDGTHYFTRKYLLED